MSADEQAAWGASSGRDVLGAVDDAVWRPGPLGIAGVRGVDRDDPNWLYAAVHDWGSDFRLPADLQPHFREHQDFAALSSHSDEMRCRWLSERPIEPHRWWGVQIAAAPWERTLGAVTSTTSGAVIALMARPFYSDRRVAELSLQLDGPPLTADPRFVAEIGEPIVVAAWRLMCRSLRQRDFVGVLAHVREPTMRDAILGFQIKRADARSAVAFRPLRAMPDRPAT